MTDQAAASSAVSTGRLFVRAVLRTDVGLVRSENQDFGTLTTQAEERRSGKSGRLMVVADGMGGHRGGATASRMAAETVKAMFLQNDRRDIPDALRDSLTRANARIFNEAQTNPELRGMGTTTSALAIHGNQGWFAHVGDSRIYMVRSGEIKQLTDDHSLVATMVREGLLTTQEAETHPRRNVLQRSMGVAEEVEIDVRGPIEVKEGDTFILCSDGLHGLVKEEELKAVAERPLAEAAEQFVKMALDRGAPDNVTVIVARVEKEGDSAAETLEEEAGEAGMFDETMREAARTLDQQVASPEATTLPQTTAVPDSAPPPAAASQTPPSPPPAPRQAPPAPAAAQPSTPPAGAPASAAPKIDPALSPNATVKIKPQPAVPDDATLRIPSAAVETKGEGKKDDDDTLKVKRRAAAPEGGATQRGSSILKWMLISVVALGAAGAWLYMNRTQERNAAPTSPAAPSR